MVKKPDKPREKTQRSNAGDKKKSAAIQTTEKLAEKLSLLQLAEMHFDGSDKERHKLNAAERVMLDKIHNGEEDKPEKQTKPSPKRVIRGSVISWLGKNREARELIPDNGVCIRRACIEGMVNLQFAQLSRPLSLQECDIEGGLNIQFATLTGLYLNGSHIGKPPHNANEMKSQPPSLQADGVRVKGPALFKDGFISYGELVFPGAIIEGNVEFIDCNLFGSDEKGNGEEPRALTADGAKISRTVFFQNGCVAHGTVRLICADLGSDLTCSGGKFYDGRPDKICEYGQVLNADRATIKGAVYFDKGFESHGEVRLLGAAVGGNLDCYGGQFTNHNHQFTNHESSSLAADGARIDGDIRLDNGFKSFGQVHLAGVDVRGILSCEQSEFHNRGGTALNVSQSNIKGIVYMRNNCMFDGGVDLSSMTTESMLQWGGIKELDKAFLDLRGADVHTLWIGENDVPEPNRIYLDGLRYDSIHEKMPKHAHWWIKLLGRQRFDPPDSQMIRGFIDACNQVNLWALGKRIQNEHITVAHFFPQPYEQAAKVLRAHGHEDSAKDILIAKELRRKSSLQPLRAIFLENFMKPCNLQRGLSKIAEKIWYHWLARWVGYGHRPSLAAWTALAWLLVGTGVFWCAHALDLMVPLQHWAYVEPQVAISTAPIFGMPTTERHDDPTTGSAAPHALPPSIRAEENEMKKKDKELKKAYPTFRPMVYAFETAAPLIKLRQADYWHANMHTWPGWFLAGFTWIYTIIGWVLTTLLATALAGLVRK